MQIDEPRFAALNDEGDQLDRDSMGTVADEHTEGHPAGATSASRPARRDFLRRAATGGALLAVGSMVSPFGPLVPAAWAELSPDDSELARYMAGLELSLVAAYGVALSTGKLSSANSDIARMFLRHHREHAAALNAALGEELTVTAPEPVFLQQVGPRFSAATDEAAVLELAWNAEETITATYLFGVGEVDDAKSAGVLATILPVESQHATVWGAILEKAPDVYLPEFLTTEQAIKPAGFPA